MTTPVSGVISLQDIRTELGGAGPISMADINTRVIGGKPAAGTVISMSDMYNVNAYTITVGANANPSHGWFSGSFGALSPTTYEGNALQALATGQVGGGSASEFDFRLNAAVWGGPLPAPVRMTSFRVNAPFNRFLNNDAFYTGILFTAADVGGVFKVGVKRA